MATYLITGAGRGLGFEMVKVLASKPANEVSIVVATIRSEPPEPLQDIISQSQGRVKTVNLDVCDPASIATAVATIKDILGNQGLDVLINNAAVADSTPTKLVATTLLQSTFAVNVTAVHSLTVALLPILTQGNRKTVFNMSSIVGSLTHMERFRVVPDPAYQVSKGALNCLTKLFSLELDEEGFTFVAVSPGWCRTSQGGPYADLDPETGAKAVIALLSRSREELNGKFLNIKVEGWEHATGLHKYDGAELEW